MPRKRKPAKKKSPRPASLRSIERETLKLLEQHGVRPLDAERNFSAERTQVVPASELARIGFTLPPEAHRYVSHVKWPDPPPRRPVVTIDESPVGAERTDEGPPGAQSDDAHHVSRPSSAAGPTDVTPLEQLRVPSVRPREDCVEVLLSHDGLREGQRFYLQANTLLFGRGERCGVRFHTTDISRNHCLIERKDRELVLVDTNSTNGVLLNGRRVQSSVRLKHADKIQINKTVFALLTPLETTKVFLSYGTPDAFFCRWLAGSLRDHGFDVFFFEDSAQDYVGERIFSVTRGQIAERDVVLLVCSHASLARPGVHAELRHVLAKEERHGGSGFLIPIALDDAFLHWEPGVLGDAIRERIVTDFRHLPDDRARMDAVSRLARRLRRLGQS